MGRGEVGVENTVFFEPKRWWKYDIYWLLKSSCFGRFGNGKYALFLRQKVNEKMIFTDYWNVLVLNFSGKENTVFFWGKKLIERLCLPITEKLLFWAFPWLKMRSFFQQKVNRKMIFTDYWNVLVLNFSGKENRVYFEAKSWWKDYIYQLL